MTIPMAMLALLHETPQHGFALKKRYDDLLGQERELKAGQVYSTLARLERDGLCEGVGFEKGSAADRRMYAITADGLTEIETWVATPELPSGRPTQLFTKVVLSIVVGGDGEAVIGAYRTAYVRRMREITAARHSADTIERLVGDYEIAHLEADLQWIDIASARLGDLVSSVRGAQ